ncbi:hypothetical protein D9615_008472 [Tricholomella constricta]|uniref:Uncharacterized protein n=1 Tax=Tricholomella constricta TaxID=117010 RepID=A0A8H5H3X8_9AGAR|nr:hypothetical protein D9615_008472 [Tricholomella constricta]
MSIKYSFNQKANYLSGSFTSTSNASWLIYSTFGSRKDNLPQLTIVKGPYRRVASIHWEDKVLDINGKKVGIDDIRFKERGHGSLFAHRWSDGTTQWRTKYEQGAKTWNVGRVFRIVDDEPEGTSSAEFKLYRAKIIGESVPASVTYRASVSESEALFILLAVLYCEITEHAPSTRCTGISDNIARAITFGLL